MVNSVLPGTLATEVGVSETWGIIHVLVKLLNVFLLGLKLLLDGYEPVCSGQSSDGRGIEDGGTDLARSSFLMYISSAARSRLVKASLKEVSVSKSAYNARIIWIHGSPCLFTLRS